MNWISFTVTFEVRNSNVLEILLDWQFLKMYKSKSQSRGKNDMVKHFQ